MPVVFSNPCSTVAALRIATPGHLLTLFLAMAPLAFCQQGGDIAGTVVDTSGAAVRGASVKLSLDGRAPDRETQSAESGDFSFPNVVPGPYRLSFAAKGFAARTIAGELRTGETLNLPQTALAIESFATDVTVTQTQAELAETQIKVEEQQRLLGVLPNFFAAYDRDAAPLNAKQKLELTARTWFDPSSFVIEGVIAGVWQAENTHKGFGQGAQGYAKRYGAGFADYGTSLLLEKVVTTTIFKQDPRYFYKGTGTKRSRALYAISRTFVCRGDNKKDQFCYSSFINRLGTGFVTNYYYPAADRDHTGVILRNSAMGIGFDALGNLFQEFVARRITRRKQ
jgi:hypothetical protein